jgi:hypothetical protein
LYLETRRKGQHLKDINEVGFDLKEYICYFFVLKLYNINLKYKAMKNH